MSTITPVLNSPTPHLREENGVHPLAPAFTAVNGQGPRSSPRGPNGTNDKRAILNPTQPSEQGPPELEYYCARTSILSNISEGNRLAKGQMEWERADIVEETRSTGTTMQALQQRLLPPVDQSRDHGLHISLQEMRDMHPIVSVHGSMPPMATPHPPIDRCESNNSIEASKASVRQTNVKERKRQFGNRTKTGCSTCRGRKKKCDEAKPKCRCK
jgi:hypothetical protein